MENQLSNVMILPLKEISLRRVAVILWNRPDILDAIGKFRPQSSRYERRLKEQREAVESEVTDKMFKIGLPESLVKQMVCFPIGLQIRKWKSFHSDYLNEPLGEFKIPSTAKLFWTTLGTIDYKKTAEELVRCDALDIEKRYRLACLYCLEDYIRVLWEELPEDRKHFYNNTWEEPHLQFWWPKFIKGENTNFDVFAYSAITGYKTAAEYFFNKLPNRERESSLIRVTNDMIAERSPVFSYCYKHEKGKLSDVLYYLLSLMTHEQQMEIFKKKPCGVLIHFLYWPWQDLFLKIADLVWYFLPPKHYGDLLIRVAKSVREFEYYFPKLFQNFFLQSPSCFRKYFVDREYHPIYIPQHQFLSIFFDSLDSETVEVIFRNVDYSDRVRLVSSDQAFTLFCTSISRGRWHMAEVCLRETAPSMEDRGKLKGYFMKFLTTRDGGQLKESKPIWNRFCALLDEIETSEQSKRGSEDETLAKAKKVCCEEQ